MTQDTNNSKNKVLDMFDKILIKHLEGLIGSSYLFSELTMNSAIISCLILLIERENEIESFPFDSSARYTSETLITELEEMGFEPNGDINIVVQDMIEKGYINVGDKYFIPGEPAKSMVKLLDRTFPGMPGMNLVAYFIQTMDEANSGRKDLDSAISQFDQMLNMQGVPLNKEQPDSKPTKVSKQSEEQKTQIKKSDILGRQKIDNWHKDSRVSPSAPKVLSLGAYEGKLRKLDFGKSFPKENEIDKITTDTNNPIESEGAETRVKAIETKLHDDIESENIDTLSEAPSEQLTETDRDVQRPTEEIADTNIPEDDSTSPIKTTLQDNKPVELNNDPFIKKNIVEAKKAMIDKPDTTSEKNNSRKIVDSIESQIAAFEEDLALECPLCKQSKVQAEETAMGKTFYRCLTKNCNFISWGKPYHILCPQCNNPFLVEASDKAGKTILKCPRSTCRYRQNLPWELEENNKEKINSVSQVTNKITPISRKPRKRVRKRRVVRRKK
jgi:ssDNA-binding Zn-finger/Zn-ribbon topoisomerase 1